MRKLGVVIALLALVCACNSGSTGKKKKVLVIESYHADFAWDAAYERGLKQRLGKDYEIASFVMDAKRLPRKEHPKRAAAAIKKVEEFKPDFIVLGDDVALKFTSPKLSRMKTPVIFLGINSNPHMYFDTWPENFTGVLERPLLYASVSTINTVIPTVKKILVIFDNDLSCKLIKSELFGGKSSLNIAGTQVDLVLLDTYAEWKTAVSKISESYDACIVGLHHTLTDSTGNVVPAPDVLRWTSANTNVPLFAFWDFCIGKDIAVGGQVLSGEEQGQMAADMIKKIAAGTKPAEISPVASSKGRLIFSKTQLARHGLTLPATIADTALLVE